MEEEAKHTKAGKASIILGIFSIVSIFFLSIFLGLIMAMFAMLLGYRIRKRGDNYGHYAIILGALSIVLSIVFIFLLAF